MDYQFYQTDKNEPWEFLWVHFNGATTSGYYEHFSKTGCPVISLESSNAVSTIQKLIKIHRNNDAKTEPLSSKLLVDLITEFILTSTNQQDTNSYIPATMKTIMKYLEKQFSKPISLDHLASKFTISKYHLAREFKKYSSQTPNEYLITCRITFAKNALKYSDQSVSSIADEIGIPNVSHFINLFKQREGMTPLSYRKKWQRPK
jgi:YesN/AraC family two-component response regulator